jgi:hypothetical protein
MATDTAATVSAERDGARWLYAALLGLVAGLPRTFRGELAGLLESVNLLGEGGAVAALFDPGIAVHPAGHLVYSALFGLLFALAVDYEELRGLLATPATGAATGLAYGLGLWLVGVAVGWPLAVAAVGLAGPSVPHLHLGTFAGHALYGLVLGWGYAAVRGD